MNPLHITIRRLNKKMLNLFIVYYTLEPKWYQTVSRIQPNMPDFGFLTEKKWRG